MTFRFDMDMETLRRKLSKRLDRLRVRVEHTDSHTLLLHGVPAQRNVFNKSHTNVLIKRVRGHPSFVAFVDEDLEYRGSDPQLARTFSAAYRRDGWRVLSFQSGVEMTAEGVVERAMEVLSATPAPAQSYPPHNENIAERKGLLSSLGRNLTHLVSDGLGQSTVGREYEIEDVASCVISSGEMRLPIVVGPSGVGKSNLVHAVARKLHVVSSATEVIVLDLATVFAGTLLEAERSNCLTALIKESAERENAIVAFEHIDLAISEVRYGARLLAHAVEEGARFIGTTLPAFLPKLHEPPLERHLSAVYLFELGWEESLTVLQLGKQAIAEHHGIDVDENCLHTCLSVSQTLPGCFPAKALTLLDSAASRAVLAGTRVVGPEDIYFASSRLQAIQDS